MHIQVFMLDQHSLSIYKARFFFFQKSVNRFQWISIRAVIL